MPWSFIIPAAVSLFSANKQAGAAQSAADTSAAASNRAADPTYFVELADDQQPFDH